MMLAFLSIYSHHLISRGNSCLKTFSKNPLFSSKKFQISIIFSYLISNLFYLPSHQTNTLLYGKINSAMMYIPPQNLINANQYSISFSTHRNQKLACYITWQRTWHTQHTIHKRNRYLSYTTSTLLHPSVGLIYCTASKRYA